MIEAILFDFNGVIINDEPLHLQVYQDVLSEEGITLTEKDYYDSLGMDDVTFIRAAYERNQKELETKVLQSVLERKTEAYRSLISDELPLFPDAVNFIKKARHHFALGIVSMARRADIEIVLQRAGLFDAFSAIVSAEDVAKCKPDPECYNLGFRKLDDLRTVANKFPLTREEALVIEDSPPGVQAAKTAGMWVLGIANTVSPEELRRAGADSVTKNLDDWIPETVELVFS